MSCPNRPWRTGRIRDGLYAGWRVVVQRDDLDGDMIVYYESPTGDDGFDDWVAGDFELANYLAARPWRITWDPA